MSVEENVSEYWFLDHYRVLIVDLGNGKKFLSVDVYRRNWLFKDYTSKCVAGDKYCLLYKELAPDPNKHVLSNGRVSKIIVTGIKADDIYETINVRWFIEGNISYNDIEKIFYWSWELIGCVGPRDNPWYHNCTDT